MHRRRSLFLIAFLTFCAAFTGASGVGPPKTKLVFVLVIDQFRYDYLVKFRPEFVAGGFNRLLTQGAVFANTNYDYAGTETAPGHATISTGAFPTSHGIVANTWYDRTLKKNVTSVEDASVKLVGIESKAAGASPHNLIGTALADEVRLANKDAKSVGISLKDRSAILPAGKNATAAFWFDPGTGRAITSTYYMNALPDWVEDFDSKFALSNTIGKEWRALGAKPTDAPLAVIDKTSAPGKFLPEASPWANEATLELARRAVKAYKLGKGPATDFLSVSLSANDYVGHNVGPDSPQMHDITLRTDRLIADFLKFLDTEVGAGGYVVAMSADHGVAPLPETLRENRIDAGRVRPADVASVLEKALHDAYHTPADAKWIITQDLPNIYLNHALMESIRADKEDVMRRAAEAIETVPGIYACFTARQLENRQADSGRVAHRAANSYFAGRAGDLFVVFKPFYIRDYNGAGASHGSPWSYDTHVPLIFMGANVHPGIYQTVASPADLAVTVAALVGINPPAASTGHVLTEIFATNGPQR